MAGTFNADEHAIGQKVKEFEDTHNTLNTMLTQLQTEADTLTEPSNWQGAAASAFKQFMDAFAGQAKTMNNQLMDTADKLKSMGSQTQQHDDDHAQQVSKVASSLHGL